jgi:hypothetical protein
MDKRLWVGGKWGQEVRSEEGRVRNLCGDVAKAAVEIVKGVDEVLDVVNTGEKPSKMP